MTAADVMDMDLGTAAQLVEQLRAMNEKLDRIDNALDRLEVRVESLEELREDLWPMIQGASHQITRKLHELEQNGALGFVTEGVKMAEVVATSFTEEDVRLLGENIVHILKTVRNLTQPEVLEVADRAAVALREGEARPDQRVGLFRAMRDPDVRRGMTLMLNVMRELGSRTGNGRTVAVASKENG